jgi:hypothetical protein
MTRVGQVTKLLAKRRGMSHLRRSCVLLSSTWTIASWYRCLCQSLRQMSGYYFNIPWPPSKCQLHVYFYVDTRMYAIGNNGGIYIKLKINIISNLITVQQDATYSVNYISVGSSTCFGCWHTSSGARTTVTTASGIDILYFVIHIKNTAFNHPQLFYIPYSSRPVTFNMTNLKF